MPFTAEKRPPNSFQASHRFNARTYQPPKAKAPQPKANTPDESSDGKGKGVKDSQALDSKRKGGKGKGGKGKHWSKSKGQEKSAPRSNVDNEGRPYDFSRVIVNFNNVGNYYGRKVHNTGTFHWEGVRRCLRHLVEELGLSAIGVIFEKWHGMDDTQGGTVQVLGIPQDIRDLCEHVEETPKLSQNYQEWSKHKSADDEMTIKLAYRRNCRLLDNDNYRDWIKNLKNPKMREWLAHCQDRLQMKYYFDSGLGCFETLDGNDELDSDEERVSGEQIRPARQQGGSAELPTAAGSATAEEIDLHPSNKATSSSTPAAHVGKNVNQLDRPHASAVPSAAGITAARGRTGQEPVALSAPRQPLRPTIESAFNSAAPTISSAAPAVGAYVVAPSQALPLGLPQSLPHALPQAFVEPMLHRTADLEPHPQPFFEASVETKQPLCEAARQGHLGQLRALLKKGVDPNMPDSQGVNAIYYAVANRDLEAVRLLKRYCASVRRARGPRGEPLMGMACRWLREEGPDSLSADMLVELRLPANAATLYSEAIELDVGDDAETSSPPIHRTAAAPPRKRPRTPAQPEVVEIDDDPPEPPVHAMKETDAERKQRMLRLNKKIRAVQSDVALPSASGTGSSDGTNTLSPGRGDYATALALAFSAPAEASAPGPAIGERFDDLDDDEITAAALAGSLQFAGAPPALRSGFEMAEDDPYMTNT